MQRSTRNEREKHLVLASRLNHKMNEKDMPVLVELSPSAYLTLCGLVSDALEVPSDAAPLLQGVMRELMGVNAGGMISSELAEQPEHLAALRRGGFLAC